MGAVLLRLRDPSSWRRRVRAAVTERLWLKATAFLIAVVIWVIASLKEPTEDELPVRLVLTPVSGTAIAGDVPEVRILVRAIGRDMLKLHQTPPTIRRRLQSGGDSATVELFPSDVSLPPGVDAIIEDVEPRTVTVALRQLPRPTPTTAALPTRAETAHAMPPAAADATKPSPGIADTFLAPHADSIHAVTPVAPATHDSVARAVMRRDSAARAGVARDSLAHRPRGDSTHRPLVHSLPPDRP